jgi:hypothetical protein
LAFAVIATGLRAERQTAAEISHAVIAGGIPRLGLASGRAAAAIDPRIG